jgi:hypothetical protein
MESCCFFLRAAHISCHWPDIAGLQKAEFTTNVIDSGAAHPDMSHHNHSCDSQPAAVTTPKLAEY